MGGAVAVPLGEAVDSESVVVRTSFTEYRGLEILRPTTATPVPSGIGVLLVVVLEVTVLEPPLLDLEEVDMFLSSLSTLARYGWGCRWRLCADGASFC